MNENIGSKTASFSNISSQIVPSKTFHESTTCILKENPCEIDSSASKFHLSYQEWSQVEPQFAYVKLQPEWTNIFTRKIEEFYPLCVLLFKYHRINVKYESLKCHFLFAEANCKFTNCITLKFWIDRAPENWVDSVEVNFLVNGSIQKEISFYKIFRKRINGLSGFHRRKLIQGETISKKTPVIFFLNYQSFYAPTICLSAPSGQV